MCFGMWKNKTWTKDTRREYPGLSTFLWVRLWASFCSYQSGAMVGADSKNPASLILLFCRLLSTSQDSEPCSITDQNKHASLSCNIPITSEVIKSEEFVSAVKRFQLLRKINWNERLPLFAFLFSGKDTFKGGEKVACNYSKRICFEIFNSV